MSEIFIEAESFETLGGWVVDQQSMRQMGSAYIMAHGMGIPVDDAKTKVEIPESGVWTVWARTRDWTAVWERGTPAGIFKVRINGTELSGTLGTNGVEWNWQKAGEIELEKGVSEISLHDLSGFNGRCDALYLASGGSDAPANDAKRLAELRRKTACGECQNHPEKFALIVAGGGIAGICTALAAIRTGSKVLLIHDRGILGGCNSSEIRVGMGGFAHAEPYPNLGNTVREIEPVMGSHSTYPAEYYEDRRKELVFQLHNPACCKLALNEKVISAEKDENDPTLIKAVVARNCRTGHETRYKARLFADCTGDAELARMMGANVMYGREPRKKFGESLAPEKGDRQVMGHSVLWYSKKQDTHSSFPQIDWGIEFNETNCYYIRGGDWEWETGQYRDQAQETEYIRDYGLMAIYANWSFLKNSSARKEEWANDSLEWVSPIGGKRESYRVEGDHILTQGDIENHVPYDDATGAMTWNLDLHFPDPENEAKFKEPFRSCAYHRGIGKPYAVPYRCLYSKDVKNLFLGGRVISVSHVAFSCVRVMRTLGILGEVAGMAASLCKAENAYPREIYEKHFGKLREMMKQGIKRPTYHAYNCDESESYHFKEIGFVRIPPGTSEVNAEKSVKDRIAALGVKHKYK